MSDVKFPLCESAGLKVVCFTVNTMCFVHASDVEAMLSRGVRVTASPNKYQKDFWSSEGSHDDTHTALLIDIKPLARERRRELSENEVRMLLSDVELFDSTYSSHEAREKIIDRLFDTNKEGGR